jgi:hypothetical protein
MLITLKIGRWGGIKIYLNKKTFTSQENTSRVGGDSGLIKLSGNHT